MSISENIKKLRKDIPLNVSLVAVSKTKSENEIMEAYHAGQRIFGENKIQEMASKWEVLPKDIQWHMIGHVQTNKVKFMAPFVHLIHAVDSLKLLIEINKQANNNNRVINCLLQIKIAEEDSKFGMEESLATKLLESKVVREFKHVKIVGLMGMATYTDNVEQIKNEFQTLKKCYDQLKNTNNFSVLSMGMSDDYTFAIEKGSNMIRVGSAIFGRRN